MRLIVVRHAHADPGEPDELRPLNDEGRAASQALAAKLADRQIDAVVSSPLLRARETAEPIAQRAGVPTETYERLAPGAGADDFRAVAEGRGETVVIVGHQPDCGQAVLELTGDEVRFPPGGSAEVGL